MKRGFEASDFCIPRISDSKGLIRLLTDKKMVDLKQKYEEFVPVEYWPSFLSSTDLTAILLSLLCNDFVKRLYEYK